MRKPSRQLLCVCDHDSVAPAEAALGFAASLANVEIKRYPVGHFEVYFDEAFERASTDQRDFLAAQLSGQRAGRASAAPATRAPGD